MSEYQALEEIKFASIDYRKFNKERLLIAFKKYDVIVVATDYHFHCYIKGKLHLDLLKKLTNEKELYPMSYYCKEYSAWVMSDKSMSDFSRFIARDIPIIIDRA